MATFTTTSNYDTAARILNVMLNREHSGKINKKITIASTDKGQHIVLSDVVEDNSVFVVLKNSDFTEGRGPMRVHKIFKNLDAAVDYVMKQKGIYGSRQHVSTVCGVNIDNDVYLFTTFNGYDIVPMRVEG